MQAHTDEEYLLPPTTPVSAGVSVLLGTGLYLVVVQGGAALLAGLSR